MCEITKTMLSCEDKVQGIANNFRDISKEFQLMGLRHKIHRQLIGAHDIGSRGIKEELVKEHPNLSLVVSTLKDMIRDGYEVFSPELTNEIINY